MYFFENKRFHVSEGSWVRLMALLPIMADLSRSVKAAVCHHSVACGRHRR